MPINPNLSLMIKPLEPQNQLAQYGAIEQIKSAQQVNALNEMKMREAQLEMEQKNALNKAYADAFNANTGAVNYEKLRGNLAQSGLGSQIPALTTKISEQQLADQKLKSEQQKYISDRLNLSRENLRLIDPQSPTAAQDFLQWHESNHADPILGPWLNSTGVSKDSALKSIQTAITTGRLPELIAQSAIGLDKTAQMFKPTVSSVDLGSEKVIALTNPVTGKTTANARFGVGMSPSEAANLNQRRIEFSATTNPQEIYSRELAKQSAQNTASQAASAPGAIDKLSNVVTAIDALVGKQQISDKSGKVIQPGTAPHPGFQSAIGAGVPFLKHIPGTDTAGANALLDQIKSGEMMAGIEYLKNTGPLSDKDLKAAAESISRLRGSLKEEEFIAESRRLQKMLNGWIERAKNSATQATNYNSIPMPRNPNAQTQQGVQISPLPPGFNLH